MDGINECTFIGRVGKDAAQTFLNDNNSVTKFSIAVDESFKKTGATEYTNTTEWITCEVFGKLAAYAANAMKKGCLVYVKAKSKTDKYQDKTHPEVTHYSTKYIVQSIRMLVNTTPKAAGDTSAAPQQQQSAPSPASNNGKVAQQQTPVSVQEDNEELPF